MLSCQRSPNFDLVMLWFRASTLLAETLKGTNFSIAKRKICSKPYQIELGVKWVQRIQAY